MNPISRRIQENVDQIRDRFAAACTRTGRDPDSARLIAVTKYAEIEWVHSLLELGITDLGESRPQQLVERAAELGGEINWHLIGHLQRNKARRVVPITSLIHSVDTRRLLTTLNRLAAELGIRPRVLLEVNVAGESQKHGFSPDELRAAWPECLECKNVEIAGLMTMAPHVAEPEAARPTFRGLRLLRDELREAAPATALPELSMGMSGDFEVAIEEGATIVRIGSSLYNGLSG